MFKCKQSIRIYTNHRTWPSHTNGSVCLLRRPSGQSHPRHRSQPPSHRCCDAETWQHQAARGGIAAQEPTATHAARTALQSLYVRVLGCLARCSHAPLPLFSALMSRPNGVLKLQDGLNWPQLQLKKAADRLDLQSAAIGPIKKLE